MNVYITKMNGIRWNSLQNRQLMIAEIAYEMGCREMGIFCYNGSNESIESLKVRIDGIIAGLSWGVDIVICQFPTGNGLKFERELLNRLNIYQIQVVIFIHDAGSIVRESNQGILSETIRLYNQAEVLVVPSLMMRQFLLDNGIRKDMKFVIQEIGDYLLDMNFFSTPQFRKEIHFTGIVEFEGMRNWSYDLLLKLYAVSESQGQNINSMGNLPSGELMSVLSKGGFGLVWYRDTTSRQEMEYSVSFELSRYLAAGIPVIVPVGILNQALIERNHLGMAVNSLDEAIAVIEAMTEADYQEYVKCVGRFSRILKKGYYTKKCLIEAVQAVCRRDTGELSIPAKIYDSGECIFTYTVLNESYGENLALSWNYSGNADGFLIYDTSGKLVYETGNVHQHFFLIRGYEKGDKFIVKAFINTLKGKLIVAASEPIYVSAEEYDRVEVSMIIPVYNAENYIARGIDTVLAQSFHGLEIIIVNDGSTDHTADIIEWYAKKYANVKILHQENGGPAVARNTGIECAVGEYIGFMDSDDTIHPEMIERLVASIKKNNCDIAITSVYKIVNSEYREYVQYPVEEDVAIAAEDFLWMHFEKGLIFSVMVWNKLYRASLVKEHLFPEFFLGEDGAWTPCILSFADSICYLNDRLYEYDRSIRENTLEDQWSIQSQYERFMRYKNIVTFYLEHGNIERIKFLKELAKRNLLGWGSIYADDKYEKLWGEIRDKK